MQVCARAGDSKRTFKITQLRETRMRVIDFQNFGFMRIYDKAQ